MSRCLLSQYCESVARCYKRLHYVVSINPTRQKQKAICWVFNPKQAYFQVLFGRNCALSTGFKGNSSTHHIENTGGGAQTHLLKACRGTGRGADHLRRLFSRQKPNKAHPRSIDPTQHQNETWALESADARYRMTETFVNPSSSPPPPPPSSASPLISMVPGHMRDLPVLDLRETLLQLKFSRCHSRGKRLNSCSHDLLVGNQALSGIRQLDNQS